ncbi:hypothetical protein [Cyclobacterium sediminis]
MKKAIFIIAILLLSSCASYRTEPYKNNPRNPAKAYQKAHKAKWPVYKKR